MLRLALGFVLLASGPLLRATAAEFSAALSPDQFASAGLTSRSADELAVLDRLVQRDVAAARQGGVTTFRGTFSSRRTPAERQAAGLDRLTPDALNQLDALVAEQIARPRPAAAPGWTPVDPAGIDVSTALKPEVHGTVTLAYGWGRGGSSRLAALDTTYYDPASRVTLSFGIATWSGPGCRRDY